MQKKEGAVEYMIGFFVITLVCVLVLYSARIRMAKNYKYTFKDGLDAACLAAGLINLDKYGAEGRVEIDDFNGVYQTFLQHLNQNVKAEGDGETGVDVHHFAIYNVVGDRLGRMECYDNGMVLSEETEYTGTEQTPNGKVVNGATVYAKVGTWMKGFLTGETYVYEESCIDIVE